jgi:hypothetical protein
MGTLHELLKPLASSLQKTGLLNDRQFQDLLRHTAAFPSISPHKLFLEYRIDSGLVLEGYGHGFDAETLSSLIQNTNSFPAAAKIAAAKACDPFASDRVKYLDLMADTDPDWIEYDYLGTLKGFSSEPAVFFSFPARFRTWKNEAHLSDFKKTLRAVLPCESSTNSQDSQFGSITFFDYFHGLIGCALDCGSVLELYRLGVSSAREPGWARMVLTGIPSAYFSGHTPSQFRGEEYSLANILCDMRHGSDKDQSLALTGSVSAQDGIVVAMDIEHPYFHKIEFDQKRREMVGAFCADLGRHNVVSIDVLDVLSKAAVLPITTSRSAGIEARLLLNHFKFGVSGCTRNRIKVYFELLIRRVH